MARKYSHIVIETRSALLHQTKAEDSLLSDLWQDLGYDLLLHVSTLPCHSYYLPSLGVDFPFTENFLYCAISQYPYKHWLRPLLYISMSGEVFRRYRLYYTDVSRRKCFSASYVPAYELAKLPGHAA